MSSRLAVAAVLMVAAGCGTPAPKLVNCSGRLTKDGTGLTAGSLTLHPKSGTLPQGDRPSGQLQSQGEFVMATYPYGPGVIPGTYKVTLSPELAARMKRPDYADPARTPLEITVPDSGADDLTLELPR